jgi:hypothetical protein
MPAWWNGFAGKDTIVTAKSTGEQIPLNAKPFKEILALFS